MIEAEILYPEAYYSESGNAPEERIASRMSGLTHMISSIGLGQRARGMSASPMGPRVPRCAVGSSRRCEIEFRGMPASRWRITREFGFELIPRQEEILAETGQNLDVFVRIGFEHEAIGVHAVGGGLMAARASPRAATGALGSSLFSLGR
jgi:hypothetical protein